MPPLGGLLGSLVDLECQPVPGLLGILPISQVCQYERLVVCGTTLEEATQRGPGLVFVLPFLETATLVDIRVKVFEVCL